MIDNGNALAIMGNHEYNAIAYNTLDDKGDFLRKHSAKNRAQHSETINQFKGYEDEYIRYIEWFKSLHLFFENENFQSGSCMLGSREYQLSEKETERKLFERKRFEGFF